MLIFDFFGSFAICLFFPITFMLRVSFTPWRKRFAVIAGFPLSGPSGKRAVVIVIVIVIKGDVLLSNPIFTTQRYFGCWTPLLCLSKAMFHSLTRFSIHNGTLAVGPLAFAFQRRLSAL